MQKMLTYCFTILIVVFSFAFPNTALSKVIKGEFEPAPPPPDGYSLIYIYRLKTQYGNLDIYIDDVKVSQIGNNSYTWFYLNPGQHIIRTKGNMMTTVPGIEAVMNILPGTNYFRLKGRSTTTGLFSEKQTIRTYSAIKPLSGKLALSELAELKKYYPAKIEKIDDNSHAKFSKKQKTKVKEFDYASPPKPGYGLVYFYRPYSVSLSGNPKILIDGKQYFKMKGESYCWLYMKAGTHKIFAKWGLNSHLNKEFVFNVVDGSTNFLRYGSPGGKSLIKIQFKRVEENLAKKEFSKLKHRIKPKSEYVK